MLGRGKARGINEEDVNHGKWDGRQVVREVAYNPSRFTNRLAPLSADSAPAMPIPRECCDVRTIVRDMYFFFSSSACFPYSSSPIFWKVGRCSFPYPGSPHWFVGGPPPVFRCLL